MANFILDQWNSSDNRYLNFKFKFLGYTTKNIYSNQQTPPGLSQDVVDQIQRPSVDSLLEELNNTRSISPVYAIPHEEVSLAIIILFKI